MTAKADSRTTARMGDWRGLILILRRFHVFDKETELTPTNSVKLNRTSFVIKLGTVMYPVFVLSVRMKL